jgi:hypothetical protein
MGGGAKTIEHTIKKIVSDVAGFAEGATRATAKVVMDTDPVTNAVVAAAQDYADSFAGAAKKKSAKVAEAGKAAVQEGLMTPVTPPAAAEDDSAPDAPDPYALLALRRQHGGGKGIRANMLTGGIGVRGSAPTKKRNLLGV